MAKIDGNAFLVGAAFCFISSVVAFEAFLSTAAGDDVVSVVSAISFAVGIPTVAYCVGLMVSRGGTVTRMFLLGILQVFLSFLSFCGTKFWPSIWGSILYSMLATGMAFLSKLAGGPEVDRFHIVKSVIASSSSAFGRTVGLDDASNICFLIVFVLSAALFPLDLTVPRPGSLHEFFAGLYSSPPAPPLRKMMPDVEAAGKIVTTTVKAEESAEKVSISVR